MSDQADFRKKQVKHYQAFMILGVVALCGYAVFHAVVEADWRLTGLNLFLVLVFGFLIIRLDKIENLRPVLRFCVVAILAYFLYVSITGGTAGYRILWGYLIPVIAMFLTGKKEGFFWSAVYLALLVVLLTLGSPLVESYPYNPSFLKRFFISYAILVVMLTYFENLRELADRELFRHIDELKDTERSLRQSEEKFRKVFQNSPDSIAMAELDTGLFVDVNQAFERTFGFPRDEILGRTPLEIGIWVNPEERALWIEQIIRDGVGLNYETRYRTRTGQIKEVILSTSLFSYQSVNYMLTVIKDVSAIKQAEATIQKRMEEIAALNRISGTINATLSPNGVMEAALEQVGALLKPDAATIFLVEGDHLVMKKQFPAGGPHLPNPEQLHKIGECLCGRAISRQQAQYSHDIYHDDRCTMTECRDAGLGSAFAAPLKAGQDFLGVFCLGFIEDRGLDDQADFLQALANEIASALNNAILYEKVQTHSAELEVRLVQIKQAENTLAESMELFRTVFDLSPYPLGIGSMVTDKYINVNKAFEKNLGYTKEQVIGHTPMELGFVSEQQYAQMHDLLTREKRYSNLEFNFKNKKGRSSTLLLSSVLVEIAGEPCYINSMVDVTKVKHLEKQLAQSQKMEAIGTLAGGIAHDFNNILSIIHGYAELAFSQAPKKSPLKKQLESVLKASDRATDLVRHILAFSRQGEKERKPVEVVPMVKESLKLLRASIPTSVEMRHEITTENVTIQADPTEIHQIVMNLCTNAYQAIDDEGGVITVELKKVDIGAADGGTLLDLAPGHYLLLRVSDTGQGIDPMVIDKIFDPYFTTKAVGQGTGLGLPMVRRIVESYQGRIHVYSEPGLGTTFSAYFPVSSAVPEQAAPVVRQPLGGSEALLLVDDEESIVTMNAEFLANLGYQVDSHTSSLAALEAFKAQPDKYSLVISDQTMPQLTGLKLAEEIKSIRPEIPIILCTGFSYVIKPESLGEARLHEILMKPMLLSDLAASIRRALDGQENGPRDVV